MAAYSQDLRERVLKALSRGEGATSIAARLEVSRRWVYQVKSRYEQSGERCAKPIGGYRHSCIEPLQGEIRAWITEKPDLTLEELCERLEQAYDIDLSPSALWLQLDHWGLTYKKNAAGKRVSA